MLLSNCKERRTRSIVISKFQTHSKLHSITVYTATMQYRTIVCDSFYLITITYKFEVATRMHRLNIRQRLIRVNQVVQPMPTRHAALLLDLRQCATTTTTTNVRIIVLPSHSCGGTLQSLCLKQLHSSIQTFADGLNGQCQVRHCA